MSELLLLDNALDSISIIMYLLIMGCEFYRTFEVLVHFQFLGPVTLHTIGPDGQGFFQRRTVNIFLSLSANICFGTQIYSS